MAPPSTENDRLSSVEEQLEASHMTMRETIAVEVGAAVKGAVAVMQQTLVNRFVATFEDIAKQQDDKIAAAITRLEGRINRSRDTHESLISTMRDDQLKFQSDVRSTLTNLQLSQGKLPDSNHRVEDGGLGFGEESSSGVVRK